VECRQTSITYAHPSHPISTANTRVTAASIPICHISGPLRCLPGLRGAVACRLAGLGHHTSTGQPADALAASLAQTLGSRTPPARSKEADTAETPPSPPAERLTGGTGGLGEALYPPRPFPAQARTGGAGPAAGTVNAAARRC
jgi:hypothetical protein